MGLLRPGRPGLLGVAAGTAVMAGTAGAVMHHQQKKYARQDAEEQAMYDQQQAPVEQAAPAYQEPAPQQAAEPDYMAELERLAQLRDQGVITPEDYDAKKKQLLGL